MDTDKVLLVTGGSRGIGAAVVRLAAMRGFRVILSYVKDDHAARALRDEVPGNAVKIVKGDVADAAGVARIFDAVDDVKLPLTGLVNNAGIVGQIAPFTEYTRERLQRTFNVNILGAFECAQQAVTRMLSHSQGGAIVNVSSAAARIGSPNEFIDYAASKGAIDTLTLGLAKEYGPKGIRVNAVRPGIIDTSIHAAAGDAGRVARLSEQVPLRRAGEPEEVADTIMWLLSEQSTYVTGALLDVAGGR
ncbi:MAG: SDR family oxidoreductase [Gammaproteobacteria bacterium]